MRLGEPLHGHGVSLETIAESHLDELAAGIDGEWWQWQPIAPGPLPSTVAEHRAWLETWFENGKAAMRGGGEQIFAIRRDRDGAVIGSTRYLAIVPAHRRVEIGGTYYRADARGTQVNPACKLLLMTRAFDQGCIRVELKCDERNRRSRASILKLGAKEEGTLRHHMVMGDGHLRDTIYFSVLHSEWPSVRAGLEARLR